MAIAYEKNESRGLLVLIPVIISVRQKSANGLRIDQSAAELIIHLLNIDLCHAQPLGHPVIEQWLDRVLQTGMDNSNIVDLVLRSAPP